MSYKKGNEIPTIDIVLFTIEDENGNQIGLNTASKIEVNPVTETNDGVKLIIKKRLIAQKPSSTVVTGNTIVLTDNVFNPQVVQMLQGGTLEYSKSYTNTAAGTVEAGKKYFAIASGEYVTFDLAKPLASGDKIVYNDVSGILEATISGKKAKLIRQIVAAKPSEGVELTMTEAADTSRIKSYTPPLAGDVADQDVFTARAYSAIYNAAGIITGYECIKYPNCQGVPISMSSEDDVFRVGEYTINSAPDTGEAPYEISYMPELPEVQAGD